MVVDAILDWVLAGSEWLADEWAAIAPTLDLGDFEATVTGLSSAMATIDLFADVSTVAAGLAFIAVWETAFIGVKLLLKARHIFLP